MTTNVHPLLGELLAALHESTTESSITEHLDSCVLCRVRLSRIRQTAGLAVPDADSIQRIVDASTPLPEILSTLLSSDAEPAPRPNEIWRVGRNQALLVWVRQVFDDGIADVVPLVLDVELADQESVILGAARTPLATELAALVSLRTHIPAAAFLNHLGALDIGKDVAEVMVAAQEGRRPSGVSVGPPITDDDDQRIEYRQALRDLLSELSPSAWFQNDGSIEVANENSLSQSPSTQPVTGQSVDGSDVIEAGLRERLPGIEILSLPRRPGSMTTGLWAQSIFKVIYLDTAIVVATLHGVDVVFPATEVSSRMCEELLLPEPDATAVALAIPDDEWPTLLFTASDMRGAYEAPAGAYREPTATLTGFGLVDTLSKHLEEAIVLWEPLEPASDRPGQADIHQIAIRHANMSISTLKSSRARLEAKRSALQSLPDELAERVARFVAAAAGNESMAEAFAELGLEESQ